MDVPQNKLRRKVEALILCIDRDDDLGRKAGIRGPIVGEEENFKAARALGIADPEDSDVNAIFAAIKVKRESEHLYKGVEVVTITGDRDVGVKSDQKIGNQLVRLLEAFDPRGIILVTDGAEDEEIIPLLQSETKILSVQTIAVKSARPLESAYFKMHDFFGRVAENPHQAKMLFGVPGFILFMVVFLSYFGIPIVEVIFALAGVYLIAKGFGYEEQLFSGLSEVKNSLLQGNIYKVFNVIAGLIVVLALISGYLQVKDNLGSMYEPGTIIPETCRVEDGQETCTGRPDGIQPSSVSAALLKFPVLSLNFILFSPNGGAVDWILIAVVLVAIGFIIHNFTRREYIKIRKHIYVILVAVIIKFISPSIYWSLLYLKGDSNHIVRASREALAVSSSAATQNLLIALLIAFVTIIVAHYLMKIIFFDYIERRRKLEEKYVGKEVVSKKGKGLGKVTRIVMRGSDLKGIGIKKKYYALDDIVTDNKVLVVDE